MLFVLLAVIFNWFMAKSEKDICTYNAKAERVHVYARLEGGRNLLLIIV